MKKFLALTLAMLMLLTLVACGDSGKKDTYTVGICQLVQQHDALDAATNERLYVRSEGRAGRGQGEV